MIMFPLVDCCRMLAVDSKTLNSWLKNATHAFTLHPVDEKIKCLSLEQILYLAAVHNRPLQLTAMTPSESISQVASQFALFEPNHSDTNGQLTKQNTQTMSLPASLEATDPIKNLNRWEMRIATLQEQLAQLALELLQERSLREKHDLPSSTANFQQGLEQTHLPQNHQKQPKGDQPKVPEMRKYRPHAAESRTRSRIPQVEYKAEGQYTIICPREGSLQIVPDSPEWFDWIASLASFRFIGKQGRMGVYRDYKRGPTRSWFGQRWIRYRSYKHYLGVTESITIATLEYAATKLQAYEEEAI